MAESRAVICTAAGKLDIQRVPKQKLPPGHVLVKTKAVALNPTDWKAIDDPSGFAAGTRPGVDFAGIIEEVGPDVKKGFQKGDRVCGAAFGGKNREHGAFGDYTMTKEHVVVKFPDHLSFDQAATLGVGITTCGQALYQLLNLPLPPGAAAEPPQSILIGGGSTATGVLGIQYAKLSGLQVLTTASPRHFDYLRSLGADVLLDYHAPVADLALSSTKRGIYATVKALTPVDLLQDRNPMVEAKFQLGYTAFGESFERGGHVFPAVPEDAAFAAAFWERSAKLLEEKQLQPIEETINRGGQGAEGVIVGLEDLRQGKVSGTKLVYSL
ncbi:hypothetical protein ARSEF1564_009531 [Beauveria bassiana]